jgi:hypothetical protein
MQNSNVYSSLENKLKELKQNSSKKHIFIIPPKTKTNNIASSYKESSELIKNKNNLIPNRPKIKLGFGNPHLIKRPKTGLDEINNNFSVNNQSDSNNNIKNNFSYRSIANSTSSYFVKNSFCGNESKIQQNTFTNRNNYTETSTINTMVTQNSYVMNTMSNRNYISNHNNENSNNTNNTNNTNNINNIIRPNSITGKEDYPTQISQQQNLKNSINLHSNLLMKNKVINIQQVKKNILPFKNSKLVEKKQNIANASISSNINNKEKKLMKPISQCDLSKPNINNNNNNLGINKSNNFNKNELKKTRCDSATFLKKPEFINNKRNDSKVRVTSPTNINNINYKNKNNFVKHSSNKNVLSKDKNEMQNIQKTFKNFIKDNKSISLVNIKSKYKELLKNKSIPTSIAIKSKIIYSY